jgi:glycosyltransferase involved in cell wall biosynthesis
MELKVSMVIPAYNVELYIGECLESAITQTLQEIEILVLNDGSKDGTEKIIQEYAKIDSRIVLISHENIGISATRNKGASMAKGEYLYFFDSDDFIDTNAMKLLYEAAKAHDLSMVFGEKIIFYENEYRYDSVRLCKPLNREVSVKIFNPIEFIADLAVYDVLIWRCLLKRSLWNQLSFGFVVGDVYEDSEFMPKCVLSADRIGFVDYPFYYYRKHVQSFTMRGIDQKKLLSLMNNADSLNTFNETIKMDADKVAYINREIGNFVIQAAANAHLYRDVFKKDIRGWLIERSANLLASPKKNHRLVGNGFRRGMEITLLGLRLRYHFVYAKDARITRKRIKTMEEQR